MWAGLPGPTVIADSLSRGALGGDPPLGGTFFALDQFPVAWLPVVPGYLATVVLVGLAWCVGCVVSGHETGCWRRCWRVVTRRL
ncbi:MAG: hypothetical protein Ct9H300mP1_25570 [Planctomycetaceae bacterium]|nr:MAG: hypothetical protein Ct9H300mP1_25570 [Planctomycetaceae bacterium]